MVEIPFPQAQAPAPPQNPLQMAEGMQRLAQQQQAYEQQQIQFGAKQALGQLAQQAFDPETGQIDTNKWLASAAQHPQASLLYPEIAKEALSMGLLDAQKHGQLLENNKKQLEFTNQAMAGLAGKDTITDSDVAGEFARIGVGTGMGSKWATQKFLEYSQGRKAGLFTPQSFVQNALKSSESGLKALEAAGGTFNQLTQQREVYNPKARQREMIPTQELLRRQGYGMAQGGGVAPPPSGVLRGVATSPPMGEEVYQQGRAKQWDDLRKDVAQAAESATADKLQLSEMNSLLADMGYDTGMFSPEKLQLAKVVLAIDPNDQFGVLRTIEGSKTAEDAVKKIGASEAFDKLAVIAKTSALRSAMGNSQKLTNKEFETFQNALVGLRTSPEGAKDILAYMEKMNDLMLLRNKFLNKYEELHGTPEGRDAVKFEQAWTGYVLSRPELYKFGGNK